VGFKHALMLWPAFFFYNFNILLYVGTDFTSVHCAGMLQAKALFSIFIEFLILLYYHVHPETRV